MPLLVIDEFTSTLDRTIAKTTSAALARLLRNPQSEIPNPKFVVLTCHTDILPWLAPDWTLDLSAAGEGAARHTARREVTPLPGTPTRSRPPQPEIPLAIRRVPQKLWTHFARHHYLTGGLAASATCYAAYWEENGSKFQVSGSRFVEDAPSTWNLEPETRNSAPVAFCAVVAALGWKKSKRITRLVTLPQFQGLGIASRLVETVAAHEASKGNRVTITASHPAIVAHCTRSPRWRYLGLKKTGSTRQQLAGRAIRCSAGRAVASFEFVGEREASASR